jgi:GT2 family glycosyltransferase
MPEIGIVLIGRNEGSRLVDCLQNLRDLRAPIVYVDSGSSDGSQSKAHELGALVVDLDVSLPFTAARARNSGFRHLCEAHPATEFVQFIDGDCVLNADWIPTALTYFELDRKLAVVCGRRRERYPEASIYNRLCDMEWDTPIGPAAACGGDALMRRTAFEEIGGFYDGLIAGEEPELCMRLGQADWVIRRIDAEMTLHDASMNELGQWLTRARRAGHAYAENAWLHRAQGMWRREVRSIILWGLVVPVIALALAYFTWGASFLLFLGYPALASKILLAKRRRYGWRLAGLYAIACVVAKFPQAQGLCTYHLNRLGGRRAKLIEYKGPAARGTP